MSAVAGGIALCAVAAGAFVLTRPDASAPPTASLPEARATIGGAAPDDASSAPMPSASEGTSAAGRSAGGAVSTAGAGVLPEASGSADAGRRTTPSSPAAEPSAPGDASTSPSDPPPEPVTPAWISDCTHYSGNGRTRQGDSGKRVLQVQCMLTKRGYGVGSTGTDGDFGPGTESAVRSFQSAKGLDADGIVGRDTWAALRATE